jgi:hypothetical protein
MMANLDRVISHERTWQNIRGAFATPVLETSFDSPNQYVDRGDRFTDCYPLGVGLEPDVGATVAGLTASRPISDRHACDDLKMRPATRLTGAPVTSDPKILADTIEAALASGKFDDLRPALMAYDASSLSEADRASPQLNAKMARVAAKSIAAGLPTGRRIGIEIGRRDQCGNGAQFKNALSRDRNIGPDANVCKGDAAGVYLQADEAGIRILAVLAAAEAFARIARVRRESCGGLAVE